MGIYLGQLTPAEVARFKAELAETLVANFCYPRFFDYRTESLHMRPVGRAKRQEVWLYLSSVDFTAWSRIDLTAAEFQHHIEGLFIQFMQRNRSFFGQQGRRRMSDVRMLLSSCAGTVAQGLRNHLTGQRQGNPPFGSPRPTLADAWSRDPNDLRAKLATAGVDTSHDKTWSQLVDHAYSHFVEPELIQPTFVIDWPLEMSPFARSTDGDPGLVERFEAVVSGMEFANAFSELNDSAEQAERFEMQAAERAAGDVTAEEGDPDYVEALSYGMPPTGGCGIGMDRLAMVLTGRDTIRDVILFPALRERG